MPHPKHWSISLLALALLTTLVLPARAAEPFAGVYLDAEEMDFPSQTLQVDLYRKGETGIFQLDDSVRYSCQINRIAGDGAFCIRPQIDGVWVTVDYLTDLNHDGIYEMLDDPLDPRCHSMSADGALSDWSVGGQQPLTAGEIHPLSFHTLAQQGQAVLQSRIQQSANGFLDLAAAPDLRPEHILYLITLRCVSPEDGKEYDICYYLKLYDCVIIPSDVPDTAPYYDAVKFALQRGFLSGTGNDTFSPDLALTRSQLGQILWRLDGSPAASEGRFDDVSPTAWFHDSASWCKQAGVMSGISPTQFGPNVTLSREQLALILLQYTRHTGRPTAGSRSLSDYSDADCVSDWAREGMEWAVGNGLMGQDGTLTPSAGVTRAELATILQIYCLNILDG